MPIEVEGPDGAVIEFPDGTPPATMQAAMRKHYASSRPKAPAQRPSVSTAIKQGAGDFARDVTNGFFALPDMLSQAGNAVTNAVTNAGVAVADPLLRAAGADRVANSLGRFARTATAAPAPTMRGLNQRINPEAPRRQSSSLPGELIGGALMPLGPKAAKVPARAPNALATVAKPGAAREVVDAGKQAGVNVYRTDVKPPRTVIGKAARKLGEMIPLAGTSGMRRTQQAQRVEAVKALGADFPAATLDDVAKDLTATRGAMLSRLTAQKRAVIEGTQGVAPATKTLDAVDGQIAELTARGSPAALQVAETLKTLRPSFEGKTLPQLEAMRADELANAFRGEGLAHIKDVGEKAMRAIYDPLRQDMGDFIRATSGPDAFRTWRSANAQLSGIAGELNSSALKSVLNKASSTPEDVGKLLFSAKPSQVRLLYNNMSSAGRTKAQGAIIAKAMEKAGDGADNISPDKFANEIDRLGKSVGVFFQQGDKARVQGLSKVLAYTKRAAQAGVQPENGSQLLPYAGVTALTQLLGVPGGISAGAAIGLIAKAYESAPVRDALIKAGRAQAGSKAEAAMMKRVMGSLAAFMENNAPKINAALNDNTMVSAAARQSDEQQNQQEAPPQP